MPKLRVLACPSCGASLSIDPDERTIKCQFCGNTLVVPDELRSADAQAPAGAGAPPAAVVAGMNMPNITELAGIGQAIRAGNTIEAIRQYRAAFGVGLAEAKAAVELLAAGQPVTVTRGGMPTVIRMDPTTYGVGQPPLTPNMAAVAAAQPASPGRTLGCSLVSVAVITLLVMGLSVLAFIPGLRGGALAAFPALSKAWEQVSGQPDVESASTPVVSIRGPAPTATEKPYAEVALSFGGEGTGVGRFSDARHIAVDPDGNIYVGEWSEDEPIQVFDARGKYQSQIELTEGSGILTSMAVDRQGTLYAVRGSKLHRYDAATGEYLGEVETGDDFFSFDDVSTKADGGVVASGRAGGSDDILVFDPQLDLEQTIEAAISSVTDDSELDTQLAVDGRGDIFALGTFNQAVFHFTSDGRFRNQFGSTGDEPGQFTAPSEIAVDAEGRVYISDFDGILVFSSDGRFIRVFDIPSRAFVFGMVFDDDNALYAVGGNLVYKFVLGD